MITIVRQRSDIEFDGNKTHMDLGADKINRYFLNLLFMASKPYSIAYAGASKLERVQMWKNHHRAIELALECLAGDQQPQINAVCVDHDLTKDGEIVLHSHVVLMDLEDRQSVYERKNQAQKVYEETLLELESDRQFRILNAWTHKAMGKGGARKARL